MADDVIRTSGLLGSQRRFLTPGGGSGSLRARVLVALRLKAQGSSLDVLAAGHQWRELTGMRTRVHPLVAIFAIAAGLVVAWFVLSRLTVQERVRFVDGVMIDEQNRPLRPREAGGGGPQYRRDRPGARPGPIQPRAPAE